MVPRHKLEEQLAHACASVRDEVCVFESDLAVSNRNMVSAFFQSGYFYTFLSVWQCLNQVWINLAGCSSWLLCGPARPVLFARSSGKESRAKKVKLPRKIMGWGIAEPRKMDHWWLMMIDDHWFLMIIILMIIDDYWLLILDDYCVIPFVARPTVKDPSKSMDRKNYRDYQLDDYQRFFFHDTLWLWLT